MKSNVIKTNIVVIILLLLAVSSASAEEFKIIVNKDNPVETLSKSELSQIFLKQKTKNT